AMFDKLLGGAGESPEEERELTPIEATILTRVVERILPALAEAWSSVTKLDPELRPFEQSPQLLHILPPTETVLVLTIQVTLPHSSGLITLAYPFPFLEPVLSDLGDESRFLRAREPLSREALEQLQTALQQGKIPLAVQLASGTLTLREFLELQVGDVVKLDERAEEPARVVIDGATRFLARPGRSGKRIGVQILGACADERGKIQEGDSGDE
ncbi:MAG: hypothetical protein GF355_14775, partial [Candidatus Eisenbacteria bacterium]|nr:hypothetical protein [Candidatus Eisenbacteria bacterium]